MKAYFNLVELGMGGRLHGRPKHLHGDGQPKIEVVTGNGPIWLKVEAHQRNDDAYLELTMNRLEARELAAKLLAAADS